MNVLITGGAGFIGSYLAEHHVTKGDQICIVDNLSNGSLDNLSNIITQKSVRLIHDDILTCKELSDCVQWADRIYHLASAVGMFFLIQNPLYTMRANILGCERLLNCISTSHSKARVLLASSSEIYGPNAHLPLQENARCSFEPTPNGKWFYATSKFTSEMLSLAYIKSEKLQITIARLFNTIGPRQNAYYGSVVPRFIKSAIHNEPITIFGTGEQTRCFCDVRDIVNALDAVMENPRALGEIINIGQNKQITITALAKLIKKISNSHSELVYMPYEKAYGEAYEDILYRQPDLKKYNEFVTYRFQWDLENSLKNQIKLTHRL